VAQLRVPGERIHLIFLIVAVATLTVAFAQVTLGGVVRVTGSGLGCPDWPLCHGRLIPPFELTTLIEYSHRLAASALGVLTLVVAVLAWVFYRSNPWILIPSVVGFGLMAFAAILGGVTVWTELAWWVVLFHLGLAELLVACMVIVSVAAWTAPNLSWLHSPGTKESHRFNSLVVLTVVAAFFLILSASHMVGSGAAHACATWPLCDGALIPNGTSRALHMGHRFMAVLVGALIAMTAFSAWSLRAQRPELAWAALLPVVAFVAQVMAGAATVWTGFSADMKAMHLSLATLLWVALVFVAALGHSPLRVNLSGVDAGPRQVIEPGRLTP
jgi:heme A synthase